MNRDEILNMPAGKEMDALIATEIMGRETVELQDAFCPYCGEEMRFCGTRSWCSQCKEWRYSPYMEYSTDIAAAWEVVLHEMDKGGCPNLVNDDDGHWALSFDGTNNILCTMQTSFIDDPRLWCDTAPLAICKAALLALGD